MSNRLPSFMNLPEDSLTLKDVVSCAKDWALLNGFSMRSKRNFSKDSVIFAPFTLLPSPFPRVEFYKAVNVQVLLNELIHNVAHDHEFLETVLKNTIEVDEFTKKLFEIYQTVRKEGFNQDYSVGLFRSDYMIDVKNDKHSIKQVEINTIAVSLAGLAYKLDSLHRFILERLQLCDKVHQLPKNNSLTGFCCGLVEAWKLYNNSKAVILIVVEDVSYNLSDQRCHEFEIYNLDPKLVVLRRTLTELAYRGNLSEDKTFFVDGKEVGVVYYRTGYSPNEYNSDREWHVRLEIERSKALKCPSIQYHLAGTKKIQQALASDNMLSRFLRSTETIKEIQDVFTGLYSLDLGPVGDKAIEMALQNPDHFVLKPQREGGGNNIYGSDIPNVLSMIKQSKERTAYILMNRIIPPINSTYIIRPDTNEDSIPQDVVSELGIYGVIIGKKNKIVINNQVGHLLRTKSNLANEGGVAAGTGAVDSPFLY